MAWIAPVIGAVASLYSSYQANKQNKKAQNVQQDALNQQQDILNQTSPYAKQFMQMGMNAINPAQNYYSSLLSGNRYLMQETLAPELNSMAKRYSGSMTAARSLYPRGGMGLSQSANLPYEYNSQVSNAMFGARRDAASQLENIGRSDISAGMGAYGLNSNINNSNLDAAMRIRQMSAAQGQAGGQGLFSALQQLQQWYAGRQSDPANLPQGSVNSGNIPPGNFTPSTTYPGSFGAYGTPLGSGQPPTQSQPNPNPYSYTGGDW